MKSTTTHISDAISAKIANMGIFCALLVLFIHLPHGIGKNSIYVYFSHGWGKIAVPFFFTASGYLLAGHIGEDKWYRNAIFKRFFSLYIPMVIWCVFYFIWKNIMLPVSANIFSGRSLFTNVNIDIGFETVLRLLALHPFKEPYLGGLWFIRVLLIMVMFSPLMIKVVSPLSIILLHCVIGLIHPDHDIYCTPLIFMLQEGFFPLLWATYFMLGLYLRKANIDLNPMGRFRIGGGLFIIGLLLLLLRGNPYGSLWQRRMTWLFIPWLMAGTWLLCPTKRLPNFLLKASFAVYLIHMFAILFFMLVLRRIFGEFEINEWLYVALGLLCFAACVLIDYIARRFFPEKLHKLLFGGR